MKLSFEQIKEITTGAARVEEKDGIVNFYRFTKEQDALYGERTPGMYMKTLATSGIKLSFKTNSKKIFLKIQVTPSGSRKYFSVDVLVNGKVIGYLDNFSDAVLEEKYVQTQLPLGEFEKEFDLGDGEKDVCIMLPWSVNAQLLDASIDDDAFIKAIKYEKKLLAYGDSITQGYDALRPSNKYITKLAEALCAEEFNKGIGGERFFPELAALKESFVPDYITVAYGTNDWNKNDRVTFNEKCRAFYNNLANNYPDSKIFAITPIWRKNMNDEREFGDFMDVEVCIREAVKDIDNITVISGFDLIPQDEKMYADFVLHPNDKGFEHYFVNLYAKLKAEL